MKKRRIDISTGNITGKNEIHQNKYFLFTKR